MSPNYFFYHSFYYIFVLLNYIFIECKIYLSYCLACSARPASEWWEPYCGAYGYHRPAPLRACPATRQLIVLTSPWLNASIFTLQTRAFLSLNYTGLSPFCDKICRMQLFIHELFRTQHLLSMKCAGYCPCKPHFHDVDTRKVAYPGVLPRSPPTSPLSRAFPQAPPGVCNGTKGNNHLCPPPGLSTRHLASMAFWLVLSVLAFHHSASLLSALKQFRGL
jgi:hypothetical protein